MCKPRMVTCLVILSLFLVNPAFAALLGLSEWGINDGGDIYDAANPVLPAGFDSSLFDTGTGLGTISAEYDAVGDYSLVTFFDHEINSYAMGDSRDNTYFNEFGAATGTPGSGQSWEIDEPGWVFGDIYYNFEDGTLDNTNAVPDTALNDVSMGMAWDFTLDAGESASVSFILTTTLPTADFYLSHTDPDSDYTFFYYSMLNIQLPDPGPDPDPDPVPVPEPSTMTLLGTGLLFLTLLRRRRD